MPHRPTATHTTGDLPVEARDQPANLPVRPMERRRNVATRPEPASVLLLQIVAAAAAAVRVYPAARPSDRRRNDKANRVVSAVGRRTGAAAIFYSRPEFPLRDPNPQDGRVRNQATPTGDVSVPGESSAAEARCVSRGMPDGRLTAAAKTGGYSRANPTAAAASSSSVDVLSRPCHGF